MTGAGSIATDVPDWAESRLGWLKPVTTLCSALVDRWTERQADLVVRMLAHPGGIQQTDLAGELAVTKQTLSKSLAAADFAALSVAIDYLEHGNVPTHVNVRHFPAIKQSAKSGLLTKVTQKRMTKR
jgi:hypothetical protein